jgi:hypothetical protein
MTKKEFNEWMKVVKFSENHWVSDYITEQNSRQRGQPELLLYKGGQDGIYLNVLSDGTVEVGEYKSAIPHIGDAMFKPIHKNRPDFHGRPASTVQEGLAAICERLGVPFLLSLCSVN